MGVLVFMLIFLKSSADEMNLMRAESPGPSVDKLVPKVRTTAFILYAIYTGITAISIIAFIVAGMPVFDSFCIGFGAAGTGGQLRELFTSLSGPYNNINVPLRS